MVRILLTNLVPNNIKKNPSIDVYIMLITRSFSPPYTALLILASYLKHLWLFISAGRHVKRTEKQCLIRFLGNLDSVLSLSKTLCKIVVS